MKRKNIIFIVGLIIIILILIPIPIRLKDGGSIEYKAVLYSITKYHTLNPESSKGYDDGWKIKILGLTIHDEKNTYIKATSKDTEITWDEITIDGVNEELLFENIDIEVLNQPKEDYIIYDILHEQERKRGTINLHKSAKFYFLRVMISYKLKVPLNSFSVKIGKIQF